MRSSADPGLQQEGWEAGGVSSSGKQALRDAKESPRFCLEAVLTISAAAVGKPSVSD